MSRIWPAVFLWDRPGFVSLDPDTPAQKVAEFAGEKSREAIRLNLDRLEKKRDTALEDVEENIRALNHAISTGNQAAAIAATWNLAAWCSEAYRREAADAVAEMNEWSKSEFKRGKVSKASRDPSVEACFKLYRTLKNMGVGEKEARKQARNKYTEVNAAALRQIIRRKKVLANRKTYPGRTIKA